MQKMLEYIILNYTWILGGSIIILLAVIGYFADKTNFGQGKQKEEIIQDNNVSLEGKRMDDLFGFNKNKDNSLEQEEVVVTTPENNNTNNDSNLNIVDAQNTNIINTNSTLEKKELVNNELVSLENSEQKFNKFEKEFEQILPKKEIIDDELLNEIDSLSLDKTQKLNLSDIPDLDDVELPEIKTLKPDIEDIWKF